MLDSTWSIIYRQDHFLDSPKEASKVGFFELTYYTPSFMIASAVPFSAYMSRTQPLIVIAWEESLPSKTEQKRRELD